MDIENIKGTLLIAVLTFLVAILVTLGSQLQIEYVSLIPAIIILLIIIFIGIISDMIGVAVTAASIKTFNARAAKRLFGAKEALFLVKHADRVASLMCDIVGDICGTVGGATGAIIVLRIIAVWGGSEGFINLIVIGLVAALTVGGKSFFKTYGIKSADEIVFFVGKVIASFTVISAKLRGDK